MEGVDALLAKGISQMQHRSFISSLLGPNFQRFFLQIQAGVIPGLMDIVTSKSSSEGAKEDGHM